MNTLLSEVKSALSGLGAPVYYRHPAIFTNLPVIAFSESGNSIWARADAAEHLSAVSYTVDIWCDSIADINELAKSCDAALAALGLARIYSADLFDASSGHTHRNMKYKAALDISGNVYAI